MSLRDQIDANSASLVERGRITLPKAGLEVQVRGLMTGEQLRINAEKDEVKRMLLTIALCVEDPATGQPVWAPHNLKDLDAIERLHVSDTAAIAQEVARLNGEDDPETEDEEQGKAATESESSFSSSARGSDERPAISAVA
jgi:hypothetical protein